MKFDTIKGGLFEALLWFLAVANIAAAAGSLALEKPDGLFNVVAAVLCGIAINDRITYRTRERQKKLLSRRPRE